MTFLELDGVRKSFAGTLAVHTWCTSGEATGAAALDPALLAAALDAVQAHLDEEGDLRAHAIAQGLLVA